MLLSTHLRNSLIPRSPVLHVYESSDSKEIILFSCLPLQWQSSRNIQRVPDFVSFATMLARSSQHCSLGALGSDSPHWILLMLQSVFALSFSKKGAHSPALLLSRCSTFLVDQKIHNQHELDEFTVVTLVCFLTAQMCICRYCE